VSAVTKGKYFMSTCCMSCKPIYILGIDIDCHHLYEDYYASNEKEIIEIFKDKIVDDEERQVRNIRVDMKVKLIVYEVDISRDGVWEELEHGFITIKPFKRK
tara:strand:+ start:569 stop:874 length:306 start_codon:yes stop_codon:yes gene_type:complete